MAINCHLLDKIRADVAFEGRATYARRRLLGPDAGIANLCIVKVIGKTSL